MTGFGAEAAADEKRRASRKIHGRLCAAFLTTLLTTTALTAPGSPAHAQCALPTGGVINCTGDVSTGVNLPLTSADTVNVFNVTGNIIPGFSNPGIEATTSGGGSPLSVFIDIAPFEIMTANGAGIIVRTNGIGSPLMLDNGAAITATDGNGITATTDGSDLTLTNRGTITILNGGAGMFVDVAGTDSDLTLNNWGAITTEGTSSNGFSVSTDSGDLTFNNWG